MSVNEIPAKVFLPEQTVIQIQKYLNQNALYEILSNILVYDAYLSLYICPFLTSYPFCQLDNLFLAS